ncbi:MAG: flagellar biosynthetic protein FliR [Phycisphaerae bacterium]|jgi:flagellar biosynthetic protein FliR|nr:flagellar biosynthetic protein FliR [Phycisphaerae bacterium]
MEAWFAILLPFVLLTARVGGFVMVSPIFGWRAIPVVVRVGFVLLLSVFFGANMPPVVDGASVNWLRATVLIFQEVIIGLGIGLAARLVYTAVQQGGMIAAQQMGFSDAGVIDPVSGSRARPIATFFEMIFALLFLAAGGHHLLLLMIARSFKGFPVAATPNISLLTEGVVVAGSTMLLFALKLAAPLLAGFLVLAVFLCIMARVLPEMNILMASFPLRVGAGIFMAAAIMPSLNAFTGELAKWMQRHLIA